MIRYSLIVLLCILLGFSSYLLYKGRYIVINVDYGSKDIKGDMVQGGEIEGYSYTAQNEMAKNPKVTMKPDISDEIEEFKEESEVETHLDSSLGVAINEDQQIQSSYKVIGPKQFVLLAEKEEAMVEINLETGKVTINPAYELDEVSKEFWNSIGKKYPEVCFIEEN